MNSKTTSIILALFLTSPGTETTAIQRKNINSKVRKYQDLASKKEMLKNSFAQKGDSDVYVDESIYHDDTGTKWVTFMDSFGRDPNPGYHDVHYMARPDFKQDVDSKNIYKEQSFAQKDKHIQKKAKDQDYLLGDDTGERFVRYAFGYGNPKFPEPHDVHWMANPDFNRTVYQRQFDLAQQQNVNDVTDDSAERWVNWPKTGKDPDPLYHDVHFMTRPDFNVSTLQWPRSLAQSHSQESDDYKYDDWTGDRWVKYPKGQEPFPPPHDPEWYKKEDFWHSIYQPIKPAQSLAQQQDDYKYDDWTGDRWVKYPKGQEPFPPPHDPEWYKKEDFWHSIYQPIKPAKSFAQKKARDD